MDVFLSSCWPLGITNNGNSPDDPRLLQCGNLEIARATRELKPRYHFAGLEQKHYERRPYKNKSEKKLEITRFIALANVGNPNKEKYLYAFNITPGELTAKLPEDCTETPFPDEAASRAKG